MQAYNNKEYNISLIESQYKPAYGLRKINPNDAPNKLIKS